jgi:hypothetical protein
MKQTVAVIVAGNSMGSAIAFSLAKAGYRTIVTSHDQKDLSPFIPKLLLLIGRIGFEVPQADVGISFRARDASWEADIIIPIVPYEAQAAVASEIKDVVTGKIVISVVNPLNDSFDGLLTPCATSAAEELANLLPRSTVVKAFNTLSPLDFKKPQIAGGIADVFVAGDENEAVSTVMQLVKDVGFHPLFAGKLAMSRTLESMMLLSASLSPRKNHNYPAGWKVVHRVP